MPRPAGVLYTLRPDIAESMEEFDLQADREGYIGTKVFPIFDTGLKAGPWGRIPLEQLLQNRETRRAPGAAYSRGQWKFETGAYACIENGTEEPVDDNEAAAYREYFDAELMAAMRARSIVLSNQEQRIAAKLFNTTTFTGAALTTAVGTTWDTVASATPIDDVEAAVNKVYDGSGLWPNALVMNKKVFRKLRHIDQIIDRITSSGAGNPAKPSDITVAMLREVFDIEHILVAGGTKNGADQGQTATPTQIWSGNYVSVCRIATTNDFREPCIGRTFHWTGDGSEPECAMETYRDETVRGNVVRARHDTDEQIYHAQAAHLLTNIGVS